VIFWHMSAVKPIRKMSKKVPIPKLILMELLVLLLFFKPLLLFLDLRDLQNLRCTLAISSKAQARIHLYHWRYKFFSRTRRTSRHGVCEWKYTLTRHGKQTILCNDWASGLTAEATKNSMQQHCTTHCQLWDEFEVVIKPSEKVNNTWEDWLPCGRNGGSQAVSDR